MSNLEGINYYGQYSLEDIILYNIIDFVRYGLLEIGGYVNIAKDQTNYLGNDLSRLNPIVGVSGVDNYKIYRGAKSDWVWETNINLKSTGLVTPFVPSGIYVNNTFYPTGTAPTGNAYVLDFTRGQVAFASGLTQNDIVQVPHALRMVDVHPIDSQEFTQLAENWNQSAGTGNIYSIRQYTNLPAVFIDVPSYSTIKGVQLGSRGKETDARIDFTIVSANPFDTHKLSSIFYMMETKSIPLYDLNNITFALNDFGQIVNPSGTWPVLTQNTLYQGRFKENAKVSKIRVPNPLFARNVTISLQLDTFPS